MLVGNVISSKESQPKNTFLSMVTTSFGIVIDVRDEQKENAPNPIVVTLSGIVIDVRDEQPEKAYSSIDVMLFEMITDVKDEQSENAFCPIVVPLLIITSFRLVFLIYEIAKEGICAFSIGHPINASYSIDVTPLGMVIVFKDVQ